MASREIGSRLGWLKWSALLMCAIPRLALASQVVATLTGVVQSGFDGVAATPGSSIFGFTPGTSLNGQRFRLLYTIDDSKGTPLADNVGLTGVGANSPITAVLTINGHDWSFGIMPNPSTSSEVLRGSGTQGTLMTYFVSYHYVLPYAGQASISIGFNLPFPSPPNWETPLTYDGNQPISSTGGFSIVRSQEVTLPNGSEQFVNLQQARGFLLPDTLNQTGPPSPNLAKIAVSVNGGADQTADVASVTTITLALGQTVTIGLLDASGKPVSALYELSQSVTGSLDEHALFPANVVLRYNDTETGRLSIQVVHTGTITLVVTPDPTTDLQPFAVSTKTVYPSALGTVHPEVDPIIYAVADACGIPPQFVKAQMAQESKFDPMAYRYEPLGKYVADYAVISKGKDYRANMAPYTLYRLATFPDLEDDALAQGTLVDQDDLNVVTSHFAKFLPDLSVRPWRRHGSGSVHSRIAPSPPQAGAQCQKQKRNSGRAGLINAAGNC